MKTCLIFLLLLQFFLLILFSGRCRAGEGSCLPPKEKILAEFVEVADLAARAVTLEPADDIDPDGKPGFRKYYMFFVDSYAVRALAVAGDLSGRRGYFEACRAWADRMLRHQAGMIPAGAYYMNYHRKPGESRGQWFVADCGSIAMGVLAVAARCPDEALRRRYLESAGAYGRLVMENYCRASGGVTDGYWDKSTDEWWCSTALFAAFAFQYYGLTGESEFRERAQSALEWLLRFEYDGTILYTFEKGAPTTIFYILEAYASALPYLEKGSALERAVSERFGQTVEWIVDTQNGDGLWNYDRDNWGVKLGGLPCHLLIYSKYVDDPANKKRLVISRAGRLISFQELVACSAGRALAYLADKERDRSAFTQQMAFTLMSYVEFLCPGELYRKTSGTFPYESYTEEKLNSVRHEWSR